MTTISERLRFRATVKGDSDIAAGRKAPTYGKETELDWQAADTIDALVAAVERVLIWVRPIAGDNIDRLAAVEEEDSIAAIDAAIALARK